jgi:hypothetical protein
MDAQEFKRAVHTLHRYFMWANRMRKHFYDLLPNIAAEPELELVSAPMIEANTWERG